MQRFNASMLTIRHMTKADIEEELTKLEVKYGMSSREFYGKYNRGELGEERRDYICWAGYYDMAYRAGLIRLSP